MNKFLVFQSDFGLSDGAVSAMEGVAYSVDKDIIISHITHFIPPYNIFEASYRLFQTVQYWPEETVFVSVVDPGVGTSRSSVVALTSDNKYIVTPNNGTLTHVNKFVGIKEVRIINEDINRLEGSSESYTFHGRDVFAYTGAKLTSGIITYEETGSQLDEVVSLPLFGFIREGNTISGQIDVLDVQFGSLWTSIPFEEFKKIGFELNRLLKVRIYHDEILVYENDVFYGHSFGAVGIGAPIVYMNSVNHMALAINQGSFAKAYNIKVGSGWKITFTKE